MIKCSIIDRVALTSVFKPHILCSGTHSEMILEGVIIISPKNNRFSTWFTRFDTTEYDIDYGVVLVLAGFTVYCRYGSAKIVRHPSRNYSPHASSDLTSHFRVRQTELT